MLGQIINSRRPIVVSTLKLISVQLTLILLIFGLAGCATAPQTSITLSQASDLNSDQIRQKVLTNLSGIQSYRFNMAMEMNSALENNQSIQQNSTISGSLDKANQKMQMSVTLSQKVKTNRTQASEATTEVYVIGPAMFVKSSGLGLSEGWQKQSTPDQLWQEQDVVTQQIKMLETATLKLSGLEKISGIDCYRLEMVPDIKALWETIYQQMQLQELSAGIDPQKMIKSISVQIWIARDTFLPVRVKEGLTLLSNLPQTAVPSTATPATLQINIDLTASDYNREIPVVLPPELQ
jgi:hypothetical protein